LTLRGQIERILPDVPVLPVGVELELLVVRVQAEEARVEPEDSLREEDGAGISLGLRREVDRVGQQVPRSVRVRDIESEERVPEHRRRVVHEGLGEDQRDAPGREVLAPLVESRAGSGPEPLGRDPERLGQPLSSSREAAVNGLVAARAGLEQAAERRLELGARVGAAVR
jgi:hypothetical protein